VNRTITRITAASFAAGLTLASLTGCGGKAAEPFKDAKRGAENSTPADTITFPDGFSNVASKCDGKNRVYVAFHGDYAYGALSVVANDPRCQ
jgi:hypothetical protein